jgi:hypothetical protein
MAVVVTMMTVMGLGLGNAGRGNTGNQNEEQHNFLHSTSVDASLAALEA